MTWMIARPEVDRSVARLSIVVPTGLSLTSRFSSNVALSDDGETIAFTTGDGEGSRLHIRRMDVLESMTVEGGAGARTPFISPDGQWVAFFADDELMKVSVDGGVPTVIADAPGPGYAGDWGPDDMIVYAPAYNSGLALVSANGGAVEDLTAPVTGAGELGHWFPEFLPDGDSVLFTVYAGPTGNRTEILTLSTGERRTLLEGVTYARYVSTGHLIYPTASKTMMAVPFDAATLEVTGPPTVVLEDVVYARDGNSQFSVSASGTLAYVRASTLSTDRLLLWVDRDGVSRPVIADRHGYMAPELSPDESRLAVAIEDVDSDIWVLDLGRGTLSRVTFNPGLDIAPLWTADGGRLLFGSEQGGPAFDLFWTAPDGSRDPEELLLTSFDKTPQSLSPDGTRLAFQVSHPESGEDIWTVPLQGGGVAEPFVRTPYDERIPMFSPDGRWIAYASNESGRFEIYVQAFPVAGRKTLVSAGGGTSPRWARNGREIFYRNEDRMMAVEVDGTGAELTVGAATTLFVGDYQRTDILEAEYDVTADGQHFIMIGRDPNASEHRIEVVLNWSEELLERVPIP